MQSHRILSGLTIFLMVVLVAVGYFLVAQPQLASASAANMQLSSVQSQIAASQTAVVTLKSEQKKLPELTKTLDALRLSIPSTVDSSAYINGLTGLAAGAGVTITGITVGDAGAYAPPAGSVVTPTPTAGASASPSPSPSPSASGAAAPEPVATGWVPTTDPLITAGNFITIPVSVSTEGGYANTLSFIKGLQTGSRLFLVTGFNTAQKADDPTTTIAKVDGYIYVVLDPTVTADSSTGKSTATPTPTATASDTATATTDPSGNATPTPTQSPTPTKKP